MTHMIERLAIVDGRSREVEPCAWLTYDRALDEFAIRIDERATEETVPLMMVPFVEKGVLDMGPEWSRRWVEERIVPRGRQNLGEILRAHGLDDYDEYALLVAGNGESSNDYFKVVPVETPPEMPSEAPTKTS